MNTAADNETLPLIENDKSQQEIITEALERLIDSFYASMSKKIAP